MLAWLPYQLPDPDPKKPYCLLLGAALRDQFARGLEPSFDTVCIATDSFQLDANEYVEHVVHEVGERAAVVVAWLGTGVEQYRWTVALAGLIATRPEVLVVGAEPRAIWHSAGCLIWHLQQRGIPTYDNMPDLMTAARHRGRQQRSRP